jgi:peptide deformylase
MKKILQTKEPVLRKVAAEVPVGSIKTVKIKKILKEMSEALKSQDDGVAIAAPQIGYSLRIFVVAGKVFGPAFSQQGLSEREEREKERAASTPGRDPGEKYPGPEPKDVVFINPKISRLSKDKEWLPEGCLSVRPLYGKTFRSKKATVEAYDENGKKFTRGASGLLAQIFQHETDHLNGILFIDHAKDVKEEKINEQGE